MLKFLLGLAVMSVLLFMIWLISTSGLLPIVVILSMIFTVYTIGAIVYEIFFEGKL